MVFEYTEEKKEDIFGQKCNLLQMRHKLLVALEKYREKYGPIFTVYFGSRPVVILCGYDLGKEALIEQKDTFSARGKIPMTEYVLNGFGITATNGERWKQMRRFALTSLRNFGMGKRPIDERIQEEAHFLGEEFSKTKGEPFDPTFLLSCAVSNIICSIVFGRRFDYNDKHFLSLLRNINGILRIMNSGWGLVVYHFERVMRYIPGPPQRGVRYFSELKAFVHEIVEESLKTLDPNSPRHFIDCFLMKIQQETHRPTDRQRYMMWFSSAVMVIVLLGLICIAWLKGKTENKTLLPPGPPPLPLIGNLLQMRHKLLVALEKYREKYGPIFTVYFGSRPVVILCGYDLGKEALIEQKDTFSARGKIPMTEYVLNGFGITATNGERWKQMRRFALTSLRNFGMGKRPIDERIQEEAHFLGEEFSKTKGEPFDPTFLLSCAVSNIICSIVFGRRFDYNDKHFLSLLRNINGILRIMNSGWGLVVYHFERVMRYIPGPPQRGVRYFSELKAFVHEIVEESLKTLDPNSPRHFIDCFLMKIQQNKDKPNTEFHMDNLVASTVNLFTAGTETVSTTLRYGFLILMKYPEVQVKVQKEIDQVLGQRCPSAEDKTKMPYTEAVINEIQRFADIIPTGLPHCTIEDVSFQGYVIPKGTDVFSLLTTILKDPTQFTDPEVFSPTRFLDSNGGLEKKAALMPFSAGRRMCPGEGLARMELFIFFSSLLQKFTLTSPVPLEELTLAPEVSSAGHFPCFYRMSAIPRTSTT
ncbi:PREDICTED: cytochrome P450 2G1-like [Nanorana parkeri]|uniref:cytochrome P450 2G1-like n=1 Tax=Nanorana parkeri TaxID=125878 RepID=UPI000854278A|nr:PREDICTED: cytochrome P450 2G1-like [Nanorana parkeri]